MKEKSAEVSKSKNFSNWNFDCKKNLGGKLSEEYNIGFDNEFCSWYAVRRRKIAKYFLDIFFVADKMNFCENFLSLRIFCSERSAKILFLQKSQAGLSFGY